MSHILSVIEAWKHAVYNATPHRAEPSKVELNLDLIVSETDKLIGYLIDRHTLTAPQIAPLAKFKERCLSFRDIGKPMPYAKFIKLRREADGAVNQIKETVVSKQKRKMIPKDEANTKVREFIAKREKAGKRTTVRNVSKECDIAQGRVSGLPAWQAYQVRRKQTTPASKGKAPRQLTPLILKTRRDANIPDPDARLIAEEERALDCLQQTPEGKERLRTMTPAQKRELIDLTIEQQRDSEA